MDELKTKQPEKLVYLDETGMDDNETYPYGWGPKGQRIYGMKASRRQKRLSIISVLNEGKLKAPCIFEGTCNRDVFEKYVETILSPSLIPGQTLIMDNATFHKGSRIQSMICTRQDFV